MNIITSAFPQRRMRRMRKHEFSRRLMSENTLTVNDLIYPMFILEGTQRTEKVASMPGVERFSIDLLLKEAAELVKLSDINSALGTKLKNFFGVQWIDATTLFISETGKFYSYNINSKSGCF